MIKEKENILYFHKRHFCLGSFQWTGKYIFSQHNSFSTTQCYLYKAMIWFIRLVDLPILSCLCQAFAMSSDIKNDLLNLQKYLLVGETSSSSTKVAKEMRNKYQKKNRSPIKLRLGNFEHINRGWVKFCSHIPTGDYTEGLKALKTTGNGNCLYNSVSVLIQGDESANLILRLSVTNALHNKRVIYRQCCILS